MFSLKNKAALCFLSLPLSLGLLQSAHADELTVHLGPNLIANSGFEQGMADWNLPTAGEALTDQVARSGKWSFTYHNTDPAKQDKFFQRLDVRPGQHLHLSLWIKGEGLAIQDVTKDRFPSPGVNLYVESYDAQGKQLNAFQWRRLPGTDLKDFDWQKVEGEYLVPEKTTHLRVGFYMRPDITGKVWVDDLSVQARKKIPVVSFLQFPNYRGLVKQEDTTPWKVSLRFDPFSEWGEKPIKVQTLLRNEKGVTISDEAREISYAPTQQTFEIKPPAQLPLGRYQLTQIFTDPQGYRFTTSNHDVTVVKEMPRVYVDAQGFTVVEGKRFFPHGLFLNPAGNDEMKEIAEGGFNTILSYYYGSIGTDPESYLDRAQQHGLKVLYSLKDMYPSMHKASYKDYSTAFSTVKKLRDKPALLSWYINDELGTPWLPQLQYMYDEVAQLDPHHPALQLSDRPQLMERFYTVGDIHGTNPYPVHAPYELIGPELTSTGIFTRLTNEATHGAKGVWLVPQIMDWAVYPAGATGHTSHQPTLDEMRIQSYASIIGGAKGLLYYSYFDLWFADHKRVADRKVFEERWPTVVAMAKEINTLVPMLLEDKKVPLDIAPYPRIYAAAWEYQNELYVLFANPYYSQNTITFKQPAGWAVENMTSGDSQFSAQNGTVTLTAGAIGSGVFRLKRQ